MSKKPAPDIDYWRRQAIIRQAILLRQRSTIEQLNAQLSELRGDN